MGVFRILMRDMKDGSLARTIRGCGSHEGWVLSWLAAWEGGEDLFERGVDNFLKDKGWTFPKPGQAFLHDDCFDQTKETQNALSWLASSWLVAMATRYPDAKERAEEVIRYFEEYGQIIFGKSGEAEQFFYLANGENSTNLSESIMSTSNALRGMVESNDTLRELYGSASRLQGPSIVVDWPRVLVRQAVWVPDDNLLRFTIIDAAEVQIELDGRRLDNVTLNGQVHQWQHCGARACLTCSGTGDHIFEARFVPTSTSAPRRRPVFV